jgi:predicted MPP superfamily phosphohydrolase
MLIEAKRNRINVAELTFKTLPETFNGYRLFFISDVHRRNIPYRLLNKVRKRVDLIIIGGDLCEKGVPLARIEKNIKHLTDIAPCIFVWGNNDFEVGEDHLQRIFTKYGVVVLSNSISYIQSKQEQIAIVGVDNIESESISFNLPQSMFAILVCHFPEIVERLQGNHPFSLVLSGHTHGGQIRFFGLGIAKKGQFIYTSKYIQVISNGFGTTGIPMRLGAPAETHLIYLKRE